MSEPLTAARARQLLVYDRAGGKLYWRVKRGNRAAGAVAGTPHGRGYLKVSVDKRRYLAHRLIWLIVTGAWPPAEIDHRDGCGANNRWSNLRAATRGQNGHNTATHRDNASGLKWVRTKRHRNGAVSYQATIQLTLGSYPTPIQAHRAGARAARLLHRQFFNDGRRAGRSTGAAP